MTEHEYIESLLSKLDEMNEELFITKKANNKLKSENHYLTNVVKKYKKEQGTNRKPRYRNERKQLKYDN